MGKELEGLEEGLKERNTTQLTQINTQKSIKLKNTRQ